MPHIGIKLKTFREENEKTQAQMADLIKVSVRTYQHIEETGEIKKTKYKTAIDKLLVSGTQKNAHGGMADGDKDDDETVKGILKSLSKITEGMLKLMDRQDRRSDRMESNLKEILDRQTTLQAEVQAVHQWDAQSAAAGDKEKEADYLAHIHRLSARNRESLTNSGTDAVKGKSDRGKSVP